LQSFKGSAALSSRKEKGYSDSSGNRDTLFVWCLPAD